MSQVDLRPLQRAMAELRYTTPLDAGDQRYVARPDQLGQRILNRVLVPGANRLIVGGPAGCGKSTELLQVERVARSSHTVFLCACDRDLDLYKLDLETLQRYLLARVLADATQWLKLTPEILQDAKTCLGVPSSTAIQVGLAALEVLPKLSVTTRPREPSPTLLPDTLTRLLTEIAKAALPPLLLIDGLEKLPPHLRHDTLGEFIRSRVLDVCQAVIVVPSWMLYGRDSMALYPNVEALRIDVDPDPAFAQQVVERRVHELFEPEALDAVARYSGGMPRDALQLASGACRAAMDERVVPVNRHHVREARDSIRQTFQALLSDDPARAKAFLDEVRATGDLPGDPELRDLMLGHGIILPSTEGNFRVHPIMIKG